MGCDIHIVVEKKWNDRWVGLRELGFMTVDERDPIFREDRDGRRFPVRYVASPAWSRNYDLFAEIAGVRGAGPEPRGMPDNASELTQMLSEQWGCDGHSHSWLLMDEALPIFIKHQLGERWMVDAARNNVLSGEARARAEALDVLFGIEYGDAPLDDFRIVFWFDN